MGASEDLDRYDTLVARHPEDPNARLVKRVVAFGDELERCWVELRDGDVGRYSGKGVTKAVGSVEGEIFDALSGLAAVRCQHQAALKIG